MKKKFALILSVVMMVSLSAAAFADIVVPQATAYPQQSGHVAYLESIYGTKKAQQILEGYKTNRMIQAPVPKEALTTGTSEVVISRPGGTVSTNLSNLRVGEYFTVNGTFYIVGRFTTIAGARVLVAFPADHDGNFNTALPRYFYL